MRKLIIDSFAGGGGASLGIERAVGRSPDIAINHDDEALAMHAANHPATLHLPHNVWKVDPLAVTKGAPVGLLWASPDCRHHSKAKGGRPVSKSVRDLAWVVVRWAREVRPRLIFLENVEEFRDWGPLSDEGRPIADRRGETFGRWAAELKRLGYRVEWRELRACDHGAPTIRKRLFLIARRDGRPIVWPKPTHRPPDGAKDGVLARWAEGHGLTIAEASALKPWRTAAEIIDWSLPCPSIFLTRREAKDWGLKVVRPLADATMARIARGVWRYVIDAAEPFIVTCNHGGEGFRGQGLSEPFATVAAARDAHGLVTPFLARTDMASAAARNGIHSPDEPLRTVMTSGGFAVAAPFLVPRYGERPGQDPRTLPIDGPVPTVVPTGNGAGLVAAFLAQHNTDMVGHDAREPVSTVVGKGCTQGVVAAHMVSLKGSDRRDGAVAEPHPTICAGGQHSGVVATFLSQHNENRVGAPADGPVPTLTTRGTQTHLVAAFLAKYYATATGQDARDPLHTATTKARFGVVTVHGVEHVIVDIGMRMLTARELARAQGFPDSYDLSAGGRLTDTAQRRMVGNSVCPDMAAALVATNYVDGEAMPETAPGSALPLFLEAAE